MSLFSFINILLSFDLYWKILRHQLLPTAREGDAFTGACHSVHNRQSVRFWILTEMLKGKRYSECRHSNQLSALTLPLTLSIASVTQSISVYTSDKIEWFLDQFKSIDADAWCEQGLRLNVRKIWQHGQMETTSHVIRQERGSEFNSKPSMCQNYQSFRKITFELHVVGYQINYTVRGIFLLQPDFKVTFQ